MTDKSLLEKIYSHQKSIFNEIFAPFTEPSELPFGFSALKDNKKLILDMNEKDDREFIRILCQSPDYIFDPLSILTGYVRYESSGRDDYTRIITGKIDRNSEKYKRAIELIKDHDDSAPCDLSESVVFELPSRFYRE